ncbi:MAG: hypothetical protein AAF899_12950 [Pseudomonadota bacterium]
MLDRYVPANVVAALKARLAAALPTHRDETDSATGAESAPAYAWRINDTDVVAAEMGKPRRWRHDVEATLTVWSRPPAAGALGGELADATTALQAVVADPVDLGGLVEMLHGTIDTPEIDTGRNRVTAVDVVVRFVAFS